MTTSIYDGPTRHELLLKILQYNQGHHEIDRIQVHNVTRIDKAGIDKIYAYEKYAIDSVKHLNEFIKELERLKRFMLTKSSSVSSRDWEGVLGVTKRLVERAEKEKGRCEVREKEKTKGAVQLRAKLNVQAESSRKQVPPPPKQAVPVQKQRMAQDEPKVVKPPPRVRSPVQATAQREANRMPVQAAHFQLPRRPQREPVNMKTPAAHAHVQHPPRTHPEYSKARAPTSPKFAKSPASPLAKAESSNTQVRPQPKPLNAYPAKKVDKPKGILAKRETKEEQDRQRQFNIEQKQALAHYEARRLASEVRKF